jgi:cardiolipin synthase
MKNKPWLIALLSALATSAITLVAVNFSSGEKEITQRVKHSYAITDPQFQRSMSALLGPPLASGNRVDTLLNGSQIFPAMLSAIKGARKTITFETYIYWSGSVGKQFADGLAAKAREGVRVHVLLDWVGSKRMDAKLLDTMRDAGVEIQKYHPLKWYTLDKLNNRTHRKLLVVDGRIGFTGGVGIADEWDGDAQDAAHWRDTHFRVDGPAASQMQAAFVDNWVKVTGVVLDGADYFPALNAAGSDIGQVFKSSRDGGAESMHLMYLLSTVSATKSIDLSMAYFVPDELTQSALMEALHRGSRFASSCRGRTPILSYCAKRPARSGVLCCRPVPKSTSSSRPCSTARFSWWTGSGRPWGRPISTTAPSPQRRSQPQCLQPRICGEADDIFNADLKRSRRVTYEAWSERPFWEKAVERVEALIDSQL